MSIGDSNRKALTRWLEIKIAERHSFDFEKLESGKWERLVFGFEKFSEFFAKKVKQSFFLLYAKNCNF